MNKLEGTLTELQMKFVQEYVKDYNGKRAYMRSHPDASEKTAEVESSKLLKREDILTYLKELQKAATARYGDIGEFLMKYLTADVEEMDEFGKHNPGWQKSVDLIQKQMGIQNQVIKADVSQTVKFVDDMVEE